MSNVVKVGKYSYDLNVPAQRERYWNTAATALLVGRTIKKVRYMTTKEAEEMGWSERSLIITLDNYMELIVSSDDEGNNGGALFTSNKKVPILPVLSLLRSIVRSAKLRAGMGKTTCPRARRHW